MGDEKSLLSVSIDPSVDADTRTAITLAVSAEQQRVMRAFAEVIEDDLESDYQNVGYALLKELIPEMTDSVWQTVTGTPVPGGCGEYPMSCCGYCQDCGQHHEDPPSRDSVCNQGYCHDCGHTCDGYD